MSRHRYKGMFHVFTRNFYKPNPDWPDGQEPTATARKHTLFYANSEALAQRVCKQWNKTHKPGKLSRKAEYEEVK